MRAHIDIEAIIIARKFGPAGGVIRTGESKIYSTATISSYAAATFVANFYQYREYSVISAWFTLNGFRYEFEGEPYTVMPTGCHLYTKEQTMMWALNRIIHCLDFHRAFYGEKRYNVATTGSESHRANA